MGRHKSEFMDAREEMVYLPSRISIGGKVMGKDNNVSFLYFAP
jgi:hypothetical protein